jgi:uncharacterized membrane-anchored protein YitT (DUF2179 family)
LDIFLRLVYSETNERYALAALGRHVIDGGFFDMAGLLRYRPSKKEIFDFIIDMLIIGFACFVSAVSINAITLKFSLVSGGTTGIALLLHYMLGTSIPLYILVINAPIYVFGWFKLGKRFMIKTILATILFSFFTEWTKGFRIDVSDRILGAVLGGVISGVGGGLVLRRGASMGGISVIAVALARKFSFPIASISFGMNLVILAIGAWLFGMDTALLTAANMYAANKCNNFIVDGLNRKKVVLVVSSQWRRMSERILDEMHRGTTVIRASGGYTQEDRRMLYVVLNTIELSDMKAIVAQEDPKAFMTIFEASEVAGRDFKKYTN